MGLSPVFISTPAVSRSYCMGLSYCMPRRFRIASELKASRQSSRKSHKEDVGGGRATPTGARQWRPRRREKEPGAACNMKKAVSSHLLFLVDIFSCIWQFILLKIHMHECILFILKLITPFILFLLSLLIFYLYFIIYFI
jgi:hypothetical protein